MTLPVISTRLVPAIGRILAFRTVALRDVRARPWQIVAFWCAAALLGAVAYYFTRETISSGLGSSLAGASAPLLAALLVAALWRRDALLPVAAVLYPLALIHDAATSILQTLDGLDDWFAILSALVGAWMTLAGVHFLAGNCRGVGALNRLAVMLCVIPAVFGAQATPLLDAAGLDFGYEHVWSTADDGADEDAIAFDAERFWTSQPALVRAATKRWVGARAGPRVFVLAIAPDGTQALFEREAIKAGEGLARRYAAASTLLVLSNGADSVGQRPAAVASNFTALADAMRGRVDPARDTIVVYLTAHGSRDAEASSQTPDWGQIEPVTAQSLRHFLDDVGIERRIVIVSACYSGSWIAPLATPDTIVLTAAAADRTSFGCDDSRQYTVFGKAVIESPLASGAAMKAAFAAITSAVAREEKAEGVEASLPQAFVGANMRADWENPVTRQPAARAAN